MNLKIPGPFAGRVLGAPPDPNNPVLRGGAKLRRRGDRYRDRRQWQQAIKHYKRYLANAPDDAKIWIQFGHCCREAGDLDAAEAAYRKSIEVAPNSDAYLWLGRILKPIGDIAGARSAFDEAANLEIGAPGDHAPDEHYPLGLSHDPVATKDDIYYCFRLILGRNPNPEEWPGHSSEAGEDLYNVVRSYVSSQEFAARGMLNRSYIDRVQLVRLPQFSIYVAKDDLAVSRSILQAGLYEPNVTAVLDRYLKQDMVSLDIGANIGYLTMHMAVLVGPAGRVIAVEPNPENVVLIEASRRVNGFDNISIIQAAAARETGIRILNLSHCNGMTGDLPDEDGALLGARTVPGFALDALLPNDRPIDLIKIDVEGAELVALSGLSATLARDRPIIISEFSPGMMQGSIDPFGSDYLEFLIGMGYRLSAIRIDGSETPSTDNPADAIRAYQDRGGDHIDIVAKPVAPRGRRA